MQNEINENKEDKKYIIQGIIAGFITGIAFLALLASFIFDIFYFKELIIYWILGALPFIYIISGLLLIKKRRLMLFFSVCRFV